jgi:type II secretory pathway component PulJ
LSSRNRGFILVEALLALSIVIAAALLSGSTIRMYASAQDTIRRKMEENDRQMREQYHREEACEEICSEDAADSS